MKKMNKKGFTLIELLAIIVILAIIAVITVPLILGIIDEAKAKSAVSSVVGYGKAIELAYSHYQLGTDSTITANDTNAATGLTNGSYLKLTLGTETTDTKINLRVDFSGDKVVCGTGSAENTVANGKVKLTKCKINGTGSEYTYDNGRACLSSSYNSTTGCP